MKQQNGFIDPAIALIAVGVIVIGGIIFVGGPQYNVWQQSLAGSCFALCFSNVISMFKSRSRYNR